MTELASRLQNYIKKQWPDKQDLKVVNFQELLGGYSKSTWTFDIVCKEKGQPKTYPCLFRANKDPEHAILPNSRQMEHDFVNRLINLNGFPAAKSYMVINDKSVYDQECQILERIPGIYQPTSFFGKDQDKASIEAMATDFTEKLAKFHLMDAKKLDPKNEFLDPRNAQIDVTSYETYMRSTCDYFIRSYKDFAFDHLPAYLDAYHHMRRNLPPALPLRIIHGELNPSNLIYRADKQGIAAIVDWECVHLGDPREDLGWFMHMEMATGTNFLSHVTKEGGFLNYYNKLTGFGVREQDIAYFKMFGISRLMIPIQVAIAKRIWKKNYEPLNYYLFQFMVGMSWLYGQILDYEGEAKALTQKSTKKAA